MNILITSGGTDEPIDGVRSISNFSTGQTGAILADRLQELGAEVFLLHATRAVKPEKAMQTDSFRTFMDLDTKLKAQISTGKFDAVVHLAAVSDFSIDYIETDDGKRFKPLQHGKLDSEQNIKLCLKRNYKILDRLKDYSPNSKKLIVVGFKLTDSDSQEAVKEAVEKLLKTGKVDFLVQNNLRDICPDQHPAKIYSTDAKLLFEVTTKNEIAEKLFDLINRRN